MVTESNGPAESEKVSFREFHLPGAASRGKYNLLE